MSILKEAERANVCQEFREKIERGMDLLTLYKQMPDWCMEQRFPSDELLEKHQSAAVIYGKKVNMLLSEPIYILNNCTGRITIDGYGVSRVYLGRGCRIEAEVRDNAILILDCYDSRVVVKKKNAGKCIKYSYKTKKNK